MIDFNYLPFSPIYNKDADNLTDAITTIAIDSGFLLISFHTEEEECLIDKLKNFLSKFKKQEHKIKKIHIFRHLKRDEMGGIVPFDQGICEEYINKPANLSFFVRWKREVMTVADIVLKNPHVTTNCLIEFASTQAAEDFREKFLNKNQLEWDEIIAMSKESSVDTFKNMARYAEVSHDPNKIQFFNYFPKPGDLEELFSSWKKALPWFFDVGGFRSSFPLLSLNNQQNYLLVNHAHLDSIKHFIIGLAFDESLKKNIKDSYIKHSIILPFPFFCKIIASF